MGGLEAKPPAEAASGQLGGGTPGRSGGEAPETFLKMCKNLERDVKILRDLFF
jgi:hypothetical protein